MSRGKQCLKCRELGSRCEFHQERDRAAVRAARRARHAKGLCTHCNNPPEEGLKLCTRHREEQRALNQQRERRPEQIEKYNDKRNAARRARASQGKCIEPNCTADAEPWKRRCPLHAAENREKTYKFREARKALGLCWRCPKDNIRPVRPGGLLCEEHRQQVTAKERKTVIACGICGVESGHPFCPEHRQEARLRKQGCPTCHTEEHRWWACPAKPVFASLYAVDECPECGGKSLLRHELKSGAIFVRCCDCQIVWRQLSPKQSAPAEEPRAAEPVASIYTSGAVMSPTEASAAYRRTLPPRKPYTHRSPEPERQRHAQDIATG